MKEVLNWLPPETRTVVVSSLPGKTKPKLGDATSTLAQLIPQMALIGLPEGMPNCGYRIAVHGAYGNLPAKNLGLLPYIGCDILSLDPSSYKPLDQYLKTHARRAAIVEGLDTYTISENQGGTPWTYYLCKSDDLLFCATDKSYLAKLLKRRQDHSEISVELGKKSGLDPNFDLPFWAFHRVADDQEAKAEFDDPTVTEVSMSLSADKKKIDILYSSKSDQSYDRIKARWSSYLKSEGAPPAKEFSKLSPLRTRVVLDAQAQRGEVPFLILLLQSGQVFTI